VQERPQTYGDKEEVYTFKSSNKFFKISITTLKRVKKVKIEIKSLENTKEAMMEKLEREEKVKPEKKLYFEGIEGFRKALTPKDTPLTAPGRAFRSLQD
jgi:hypothetical protein